MNSFISKLGKWLKNSAFGLIVTSIALVFVIAVGIIVNDNSSLVGSVNNSGNKVESVVESLPVTSDTSTPAPTIEKIRMPFTVNAKIARYFFDSSDSMEIKSQALVSYDNKVSPSLGVDYTYENETFSVVNSFKGVVVKKTNDPLYGLTVVVENEDGLRAYYSGLSDVSVYVDETVVQGQLIGKSGESIINASLGNHLHFKVEYNNEFINPLKTYNKTVAEIVR